MSGRYSVRRHPLEQHIGDAQGRIALWLDETAAVDVAAMYGPNDGAYNEILEAVERAYPRDNDDDA